MSTMCGRVAAQTAASPPLEAKLKTILKLSKVDWGDNDVPHRGTVLKVNSGSFLYGTPPDQLVICAATVQKGSEQAPRSFCRSMTKSSGGVFLPAGKKLYITNIKVNPAKETVTLDLAAFDVDPKTQAPLMPTLKSSVNFVFSGGYLAKADAGQVAEAIGNDLPTDGAAAVLAATQPAAPPEPAAAATTAAPMTAAPMTAPPMTAAPMTAAPAPPPVSASPITAAPVTAAPAARTTVPPMTTAPPAPTTTGSAPPAPAPPQVELGMTEEEVKSILGPPTKANQPAGNTKVYLYLKQITFRDGKVSSIE